MIYHQTDLWIRVIEDGFKLHGDGYAEQCIRLTGYRTEVPSHLEILLLTYLLTGLLDCRDYRSNRLFLTMD